MVSKRRLQGLEWFKERKSEKYTGLPGKSSSFWSANFRGNIKSSEWSMLEGEIPGQGFFLSFFNVYYLAMQGLSCSMQDLLVAVCGIYDQGSNPSPLHWEHGVFAPGPPGKSPGHGSKTKFITEMTIDTKFDQSLFFSHGCLISAFFCVVSSNDCPFVLKYI